MAIRFDGSTGAIYRTSSLVNLDANYTVCFWMYVVGHPGAEDRSMLWHQNPGGPTSIDALTINEVSASDSRLNIYTLDGAGGFAETDGATSLSLNTWYHIGLIRSANNSRIAYINAVQQVNHTTSLSGRSASATMDMGVTVAATGDWYNGRMAAIKIWTAALSVAELANEMYYVIPMRTTNLNQWHPCMPGSSERLADYSGGGRNWTALGTLTDEDGPPIAYAPAYRLIPVIASGTNYTQSNSGTLTSAGAITKQTNKVAVGTLTSAGVIVRSVVKSVAGTLTTAGAITKRAAKSLVGALTTAGALVADYISGSATYNQVVGGTLTTAGALARQTSKSLAGTLTTAGAMVRRTSKSLAGTLTTAGALLREWFSPSAAKLDVTLTDARAYTCTLTDARVYTCTLNDTRVYTVTLGDSTT